jgi:hypothetical protein
MLRDAYRPVINHSNLGMATFTICFINCVGDPALASSMSRARGALGLIVQKEARKVFGAV